MNDRSFPSEPVADIGAGPIGLAAAAQLVQRAMPVQVFEAGNRVAANLAAVLAPLARMPQLVPQLVPHLHFGARVVAALAGDLQAADDVQLGLPETGVCAIALAGPDNVSAGAACSGGSPKTNASACCALDEQRQASGEAGCGCSTPAVAAMPAAAAQATAPAQKRSGAWCA